VFTSLPLFAMGRRCREFVVTCCSMDGFLLAVTCLQISGTTIAVLDAAYVDWWMSLSAGHEADHSGARYFIRSINLIFKGNMSDSFTNYNYVGNTKVSVSIKKTNANKYTLSEIFLTEILKSFSVF